jgi:hypothetical protein
VKDPLITAKPTPACLVQGEAIDGGQCRGKPSAGYIRYGPVTTDPFMGEAPVTATPVANLQLGQYAGSLRIAEMKA